MNTSRPRRSLAAVATAIACLATMAGPAAATPAAHTATITGGTFIKTKTTFTIPIDLAPTPASCAPATFNMATTSTTTSSTATVTGFNWSHRLDYGTGPTHLTTLTQSTMGNVPGHIDSTTTPHTLTGLRVGLIWTVYSSTGCTPTGTPVCTLAVLFNLSGTTTSLSTSTTFSFNGSSQGSFVGFSTCTAGPAFSIGATSSVTLPITGHLVVGV